MARKDCLTNFLIDVADAIKTKRGDKTPIKACEFDQEIKALQYGVPNVLEKTITENGTYKASDEGLDGYSEVNVDIKADVGAYFKTVYGGTEDSAQWATKNYIVKLPEIYIDEVATSIRALLFQYKSYKCPKIICGDNVSDMHQLYYQCSSNEIDVSGLNTASVEYMSVMFGDCENISSLDLSNFNTGNVTTMSSMFSGCKKLKSLDLSSFDTGNVTEMNDMFRSCNYISSLDLSNFNTGNVTTMSSMFRECNYITSLDLSSFDTSNVTNMSNMFQGCKKLTHLDIRNFDFTNVTLYNNMFGITSTNLVPVDCLIIVKDDAAKTWLNTNFSTMTNVKTVAEYEEMGE